MIIMSDGIFWEKFTYSSVAGVFLINLYSSKSLTYYGNNEKNHFKKKRIFFYVEEKGFRDNGIIKSQVYDEEG